jgi:hypothetical protein
LAGTIHLKFRTDKTDFDHSSENTRQIALRTGHGYTENLQHWAFIGIFIHILRITAKLLDKVLNGGKTTCGEYSAYKALTGASMM